MECSLLFCLFLCLLFTARDEALGANTAKDQSDAQPLHAVDRVAEPDDREDHGEHLARDGDGDEEER